MFLMLHIVISDTVEWKSLEKHAEYIKTTHLRSLLQDEKRSNALVAEHNGIVLDYSRQNLVPETMVSGIVLIVQPCLLFPCNH